MITLAFLDFASQWWRALDAAQQVFYGIGLVAAFFALVLAVLGFVGMEHHDGLDATAGDIDHGGGGIFSIKPLTGFFLGFGWAGGLALESGLPLIAALACAALAGGVMMAIIIGMFRLIYAMRSNGTVQMGGALGAIGTVYITLPAAKAPGGQVTLNFHGRQETLSALNLANRSIASGEKVKVVEVLDGSTVLVEPLA